MESTKSRVEKIGPVDSASRIGERALWGAGVFVPELGINDPLTHLEQYLEEGEAAIDSIEEDFITDCAERLEKPRFINSIKFDRMGNDFVSRENHFSMRNMTNTTEYKFAGNATDIRLYARAKIESKEVSRLNSWFDNAEINDVYIVESMPITDKETYTVVRIHQKTDARELTEHVVTLHNSSVDIFNRLHAQIDADVAESQTPMELLDNMYAYHPPSGDFEGFLGRYVAAYDGILASQNPGQKFSFGLEKSEHPDARDDLAMVRGQTALRSVYLDSLRALGRCGGYVTAEITRINKTLGLDLEMSAGSAISSGIARELLSSSLQYVVATLNRAPQTTLDALAISGDKASAVESAGYYGGEAREAGIKYEGACPTGPGAAAGIEAATAAHGHRMNKDPANCVKCPKCTEVVDLPKELLKKNIMHCVKCKASVHTKGGRVDPKIIADFYGKNTSPVQPKKETELQRIERQGIEKKILERKRRQTAEMAKEPEQYRFLEWVA